MSGFSSFRGLYDLGEPDDRTLLANAGVQVALEAIAASRRVERLAGQVADELNRAARDGLWPAAARARAASPATAAMVRLASRPLDGMRRGTV